MITVKDVYKSYEKTEVLHGISLEVNRGEIHGLIGENSAGKTTLIKCITGIYQTDKGSIKIDNEAIYDNPEAKRVIGYVADYNEYIGFYSAKRMVKMYQGFYPDFDAEKFNSLNDIFQLPLEKSVSSLSKGQKMRLAIMLEIAKKPKYLILDEPTSGLDPVAKDAFYKVLIKETEENEIGVLISSHNLEGLEKTCDTVTMIHHGKVEQQMSMEGMKEVLTKVNAVFEGGAGADLYHCEKIVRISNVGSIYTLMIKDYDKVLEEELKSMGASFIEPVQLSLEELFVTLEENRGQEMERKNKE